jgi:hypothetical protein
MQHQVRFHELMILLTLSVGFFRELEQAIDGLDDFV